MSGRDRQWHDELSDLISEEANAQLGRARRHMSKQRARRRVREEAQQAKELLRDGLRRDELEPQIARMAVAELERKYAGVGALPVAVIMLLAALAIIGVVIFNPDLFPILGAAFGFGIGSAAIYGSHQKSKALLGQLKPLAEGARAPSQPVPTARDVPRPKSQASASVVPDALGQRIEDVCDRLEAALAEVPAQVRAFLSLPPHQTLAALRTSARDFQQRERGLRALSTPEVRARVQADDDALQARIDRANDGAVRESLSQARAALLQRGEHLDDLQRSADRLEAERMRLSYTLESLLAQVLRIQYSEGALSTGELPLGLREGLEKLHGELAALADASEAVGRIEGASLGEPIAEVYAPDPDGDGSGRSRTRERD